MYLLEIGGVEAQNNVDAENGIDYVVEDEHCPACVLPEGDPPRNDHDAVQDHRSHEQIPVQLARVLSLPRLRSPRYGFNRLK